MLRQWMVLCCAVGTIACDDTILYEELSPCERAQALSAQYGDDYTLIATLQMLMVNGMVRTTSTDFADVTFELVASTCAPVLVKGIGFDVTGDFLERIYSASMEFADEAITARDNYLPQEFGEEGMQELRHFRWMVDEPLIPRGVAEDMTPFTMEPAGRLRGRFIVNTPIMPEGARLTVRPRLLVWWDTEQEVMLFKEQLPDVGFVHIEYVEE